MRFLVTSDLHGKIEGVREFARLLASASWDAGIIAGDVLDDGIPTDEMEEVYANTVLGPDDFLAELPGEEEKIEDFLQKKIEELHNEESPYQKALVYREEQLRKILSDAGKPVYLIRGNHDQTAWATGGCVTNIEDRKIGLGGISLVGYRWTPLGRSLRKRKRDAAKLRRLVDRTTILVTHDPPFGIMDEGSLATIRRNPLSEERGPIGSPYLKRLVEKKLPLFHVFGHTHRGFGISGRFINAAYPRSGGRFISLDSNTGETKIIPQDLSIKGEAL